MNQLDFHQPEWTHRKLTQYYVKFKDGRRIVLWAYDATDAKYAVSDNGNDVIEYGTHY